MSQIKLKTSLLLLGKFAISITVLWFLIHSAQLKPGMFVQFFHQPTLSLAVILLILTMIVLGAWRWHLLNNSQGIHLTYSETVTASYLGAAFNYLLPGSVGGDVVKMYYVFKKNPQKKSTILLTVFFDRVIGFIAVFLTISFVAILGMDTFRDQPKLFGLLVLCTVFCICTLAVFPIFLFLPERIGLTRWLSQRFPSNKLIKHLVSLLNAMNKFRLSIKVTVKCLAISVLVQTLMVCTVMLIAKMLAFPGIAFSDYTLAMGITQIVNLIPITPGGVGIGEMAFANILKLLNPNVVGAFATIFFTFRVMSILTYLPGVIYYIPRFILLKQQSKLEESTAQV